MLHMFDLLDAAIYLSPVLVTVGLALRFVPRRRAH